MDRIVVGMSGGVDSSVAAALLLERGFAVHGVVLKLWKAPQPSTKTDDIGVNSIADTLGIPLIEVDLTDTFYQEIVTDFAKAYASGITPNPCVICNPTLKFRALLEIAHEVNAQWIATGHYARVVNNGHAHLLRGCAKTKDQSYVLYRLGQQHLQHLKLPLGELADKSMVRQLARELNLPSAEKSESQDLCFMEGGDYRSLIGAVNPLSNQPGPILDESGNQLGTHQGLAFYTIGQRSGLGISSTQRLFVLKIDADNNVIIVGPRTGLASQWCRLNALSFTSGSPPDQNFSVMGRYRYRAPEVPVFVTMTDPDKAIVRFDKPQQMIAPGQSLVFYHGDEVLGGGIIANASLNKPDEI
jgi:tRNA-specific 2-thiouridylase